MADLIARLKGLGRQRLMALGAVGLLLTVLLGALVLRAAQPPMAPLFSDMDTRDAAQVVAALDRAKAQYRLTQGGTQIMAPLDDVARLRLMLARDGLPAGGSIGNEIFDRGESLASTPFQQEMNRLRALEGELARTIRGLSGVRNARVHLVLPRREAFSRERAEAQASVVLFMQGAQRLDKEGVQAVLHLVATAVPGLKATNISIVDSRGELLARGGQALAGPGGDQTDEEQRRAQEIRLARNVEEMLERVIGPGRVRAEANVEMDFEKVQTTEDKFDPDNQVPRSQQSSTSTSQNTEPTTVSVANNLPGADAATPPPPTSQESRQEETTNYEIGRTTRTVTRDHAIFKRISVAVLVDGIAEPQPQGTAILRPRNTEELARLTSLVKTAVGFNEARGDQVQVVSEIFTPLEEDQPAARGFLGLNLGPGTITRLTESGLLALVALLAILLIGRPVAGRLVASLAPERLAKPGEAQAALPGGNGDTPALGNEAGDEPEAMISLAHVEGQLRAAAVTQLGELVERHPEEALSVLRGWLQPEEA